MANREKQPIPDMDSFKEILNKQFFNGSDAVALVPGFGANWEKSKLHSVIVTACHLDVRTVKIKSFQRILFLKALADSDYSIEPCLYIMALRDIANGYDRGDIKEKIDETSKFLKQVFYPRNIELIVDDVEIRNDTRSILSMLLYERSLRKIIDQIDTEDKLKNATSVVGVKQKSIPISEEEKEYLRIYFFERDMLDKQILNKSASPYISWGLWSQSAANPSYNIYDKSNAGAAILRKLVCIDNDVSYSGTIVLPDPVNINGMAIRSTLYDTSEHPTLLISDSCRAANLKICGERTSPKFLDYLVENILLPFAPTAMRKDINQHKYLRKDPEEYGHYIFKRYWQFIKPYYDIVEGITGANESLFVPEKSLEEVFDTLGSKRNRAILIQIANAENGVVVNDLCDALIKQDLLKKGAVKGLYRNLQDLEDAGLIEFKKEGKKIQKYYIKIGSKTTTIRIRWPLLSCTNRRSFSQNDGV